MKRQDIVVLYLPAFVFAVLLLMQQWLSFRIKNKLDDIERLLNSRETQTQIENLGQRLNRMESQLTEQAQEQAQADAKPQPRQVEGTAFPLIPDPYFQKLYKGNDPRQSIVVGVAADERGFNRVLENSAQFVEWHDYYTNDCLAQRHWRDPNQWAPHLAIRIEVSSDNRDFKIYLRRGVKWHRPLVDAGDPKYKWLDAETHVTSKDFYFAYTTIMHPQIKASHLKSNYYEIESFTIIDDHTFSIRWKKSLYTNLIYTFQQFPLPQFLYSRDETGKEFSSQNFAEGFNKHWYNDRMMGCGPYILSRYEPGKHVEMIRNEEYYGYRPAIEKVRFVIASDNDNAYQMLRKGEINVIPRLPENIYREVLSRSESAGFFQEENFVTQVYPMAAYYHIKWNLRHPLFRDKMVRRAMTHCFNREWVLKNLFLNLGTITVGEIPTDSPYHNKDLENYAYDLDLAAKILKECGWNDENGDGILEKNIDGRKIKFQFVLEYPKGSVSREKMYAMYQKALRKVGVDMTPAGLEWSESQTKAESRNFAAMHGAWLTDMPLVDFDQIWHSRFADEPGSSNQIYFRNAEVDLICQKMREASVLEERIRLAYRMQEILHEEQPYTFLFFAKAVVAFTTNVKNRFVRPVPPYILVHPYYMSEH